MVDLFWLLFGGALVFGRRVALSIPGADRGVRFGWVLLVVLWSLVCYLSGVWIGGVSR